MSYTKREMGYTKQALEASGSQQDLTPEEREWKRQAVLAFNLKMNQAELDANREQPSRRIILLQRDRKTLIYHKVWLLMLGHEVVCAKSPSEVLTMLRRVQAFTITCDMVFTDGINYPGLVKKVRNITALTKIVEVVPDRAFEHDNYFEDAFTKTIDGVLRKSDSIRTFNRILQMVASAFDRGLEQYKRLKLLAEMKKQEELNLYSKCVTDHMCYDLPLCNNDSVFEDYQIAAAVA